jgi:isoleucyl-tRNA synthetase
LVTLSQLLAPATPFISEELYQNLVVQVDADAPNSVHLSRWPVVNVARIDEQLSIDMDVVQRVTSLGHAARQLANLKVRQPLAQVVVRTRSNEERAGLMRLKQFVLDELNVKTLDFTDAAGDLVDVSVFPYPKQLGQKYGKGYPKIRQAMSQLDQFALATRFEAGESVEVEAEGETYVVAPEDVEVRSTPRQGFSVAEQGGYLVAVTTEVDTALEQEGYARELVRRIQQLRKDAALAISDRIVTYVADQAEDGTNGAAANVDTVNDVTVNGATVNGESMVHRLLVNFGDYVRDETLTVDLVHLHADQRDTIPHHLPQASFELGDNQVTIAVAKK